MAYTAAEPELLADLTRRCTRCRVKPRWSRHGNCRLCAACTNQTRSNSVRSVRRRKLGLVFVQGETHLDRCNRLDRERYALLKAAGVPRAERNRARTSWSQTSALLKRYDATHYLHTPPGRVAD